MNKVLISVFIAIQLMLVARVQAEGPATKYAAMSESANFPLAKIEAEVLKCQALWFQPCIIDQEQKVAFYLAKANSNLSPILRSYIKQRCQSVAEKNTSERLDLAIDCIGGQTKNLASEVEKAYVQFNQTGESKISSAGIKAELRRRCKLADKDSINKSCVSAELYSLFIELANANFFYESAQVALYTRGKLFDTCLKSEKSSDGCKLLTIEIPEAEYQPKQKESFLGKKSTLATLKVSDLPLVLAKQVAILDKLYLEVKSHEAKIGLNFVEKKVATPKYINRYKELLGSAQEKITAIKKNQKNLIELTSDDEKAKLFSATETQVFDCENLLLAARTLVEFYELDAKASAHALKCAVGADLLGTVGIFSGGAATGLLEASYVGASVGAIEFAPVLAIAGTGYAVALGNDVYYDQRKEYLKKAQQQKQKKLIIVEEDEVNQLSTAKVTPPIHIEADNEGLVAEKNKKSPQPQPSTTPGPVSKFLALKTNSPSNNEEEPNTINQLHIGQEYNESAYADNANGKKFMVKSNSKPAVPTNEISYDVNEEENKKLPVLDLTKNPNAIIATGPAKTASVEQLAKKANEQLLNPNNEFDLGQFLIEGETADTNPKVSQYAYQKKLAFWQELKAEYQKIAAQTKGSVDDKINAVVNKIHETFSKKYVRFNARMVDFLDFGGGNCDAEAKFIIAALKATKLDQQLPPHQKLGVEVFGDHVQAVIYDSQANTRWQLLTNAVEPGVASAIYSYEEFLISYVRGHKAQSGVTPVHDDSQYLIARKLESKPLLQKANELWAKAKNLGGAGIETNTNLHYAAEAEDYLKSSGKGSQIPLLATINRYKQKMLISKAGVAGSGSSSGYGPENNFLKGLGWEAGHVKSDEAAPAKDIYLDRDLAVYVQKSKVSKRISISNEFILFPNRLDYIVFQSLESKAAKVEFLKTKLAKEVDDLVASPEYAKNIALFKQPDLLVKDSSNRLDSNLDWDLTQVNEHIAVDDRLHLNEYVTQYTKLKAHEYFEAKNKFNQFFKAHPQKALKFFSQLEPGQVDLSFIKSEKYEYYIDDINFLSQPAAKINQEKLPTPQPISLGATYSNLTKPTPPAKIDLDPSSNGTIAAEPEVASNSPASNLKPTNQFQPLNPKKIDPQKPQLELEPEEYLQIKHNELSRSGGVKFLKDATSYAYLPEAAWVKMLKRKKLKKNTVKALLLLIVGESSYYKNIGLVFRLGALGLAKNSMADQEQTPQFVYYLLSYGPDYIDNSTLTLINKYYGSIANFRSKLKKEMLDSGIEVIEN